MSSVPNSDPYIAQHSALQQMGHVHSVCALRPLARAVRAVVLAATSVVGLSGAYARSVTRV